MPRPLEDRASEDWWLEAFEGKHSNPPKQRVVFYGDSDISHWDTDEGFPTLGSLNCGVSGTHLKHAREYGPRMCEKYDPKVVVLVAGENDLAEGSPPANVLSDFVLVYEAIRSSGAHLVYIGTKSEPSTHGLQEAYRMLNRLVEDFVKGKEGVTFIDCYDKMLLEGMPDESLFCEDGLHLSSPGYCLWGELVLDQLERLGCTGGGEGAK